VSAYSTLNPNYAVDSMQLVLHDSDAIESELENCLGIAQGEHWFEPTFGADLRRYIGEPIDNVTAAAIWMEVLSRIATWMPHIAMMRGSGVRASPDERLFYITIQYHIKSTGLTGTFARELSA
jgi:phage baseplate assembly protein W